MRITLGGDRTTTRTQNRPTIVGVHVADGPSHGDFETGNWMRHLTPSVLSKINEVLSGSTGTP
jgi:hypothetical protein